MGTDDTWDYCSGFISELPVVANSPAIGGGMVIIEI